MAIKRELLRFLLTGSTNTAASWLVYLLGLHGLSGHTFSIPAGAIPVVVSADKIAYTIAYLFGIVFTYYLNTRWVFRVAMTWRSFLQFPLVYVVQYSLGIALMYVLVDSIHFPATFAPLAVIALTMPVSFLLSRVLLTRNPARPQQH